MSAGLRRAPAILLAAVPLAMVVVTVLDVVGRRLDRPLPGAIEIIELLMGALVFGALPAVTASRAPAASNTADTQRAAPAGTSPGPTRPQAVASTSRPAGSVASMAPWAGSATSARRA